MPHAFSTIDELGDGYGFRKVRHALGVTAFGVNAIVMPPRYEGFLHYHDTQDELYFVHSGIARVEVDGDEQLLGPGGLVHVEATTPRRVRTAATTTSSCSSSAARAATWSATAISSTPTATWRAGGRSGAAPIAEIGDRPSVSGRTTFPVSSPFSCEDWPMWPISVEGFRHNLAALPDRARPQRLVAERDGRDRRLGRRPSSRSRPRARTSASPARPSLRPSGTEGSAPTSWSGRSTPPPRRRRARAARRPGRTMAGVSSNGAVSRRRSSGGSRHSTRARWTLAEVERARAEAADAGYEIVPFSACRPEEIFAVDAVTSRDIPMDEPMTDLRFEEWEQRHWSPPSARSRAALPCAWTARSSPRRSSGWTRSGSRAWNDMTGTLPAHRGRGLARLLKLVQAEWLAARGVTRVVTENDETNRAMLAVNERLGFRPIGSVFSYAREPL